MTRQDPQQPETRRFDLQRDRQDLFMLFAQVFGHYVTEEMWRWKYMPEWCSDHMCWIGRCDDRVVGFLGAMQLRGIVDGEPAPFFQLADVMVHPDYRSKFDWFGLGTSHVLADLVANHPKRVIYGFSNHRSFLWFKKLGICDLVEQPRTCYVEPDADAPGLECHAIDWHGDEVDAHWDRMRAIVRTGLVRDGRYLRWRYEGHPHYAYRLFSLRRDGEPVGWAVIEGGKSKPHTTIIDALVPQELRIAMLQGVARTFERPARAWFAAPHTPDLPDLRPTKTNVYAFVKETTQPIEALRDNLYFTMGDADWW